MVSRQGFELIDNARCIQTHQEKELRLVHQRKYS